MRDLSSGNINILDPEEIIDIVFGHPMVKLLMTFFQIISAISWAVFLFKLMKKAKPCPAPRINVNLNAPAIEEELHTNVNNGKLGDRNNHLNDEAELSPSYESSY